MTGDGVRWMTYADLAETLGIGSDSARNLVRRKRWARRTGNDGLAHIGVPVVHLEAHVDGGSDTPIDPPINPPIEPPTDGGTIAALEAHLGSLQAEVARLAALNATGRTDLEREQGRADALTRELAEVRGMLAAVTAARDTEAVRGGQVAVLEAVLDLERQRLAEAQAEADRWRKVAAAPRGVAALLARWWKPPAD